MIQPYEKMGNKMPDEESNAKVRSYMGLCRKTL